MNPDHLYDATETRQALGKIGLTKFYELLKSGQLKAVKVGRRTFCRGRDIQDYLDGLQAYPANKGA